MTVSMTGFPNCCTAKVVYGFGGSNTAMYSSPYARTDKKQFAEEIKKHMEIASQDGNGFLVATTTSQQTVAEEVLESLGWTRVTTANKGRHSETKLSLWHWLCRDEYKAIVKVTNPFLAPVKPVETAKSEGVRVANRNYEDYKLVPRDIWIRIDGSRPMPEALRGVRVAILTRGEVFTRARIDSRLHQHEPAQTRAWGPDIGLSTISHIYIPSQQ